MRSLGCGVLLWLCSVAGVSAQTPLPVSHLDAQFQWDLQPYTEENAPESHVLTCDGSSVTVTMPATSIPIRDVVPGPGSYTCTIYAQNAGGRQVEPDVPFPLFESGYTPGVPFQLQVLAEPNEPPPPPTVVYFGSQTYDADDTTGSGQQLSQYAGKLWVAPVSGTLRELSAYVKPLSGTVTIRVGLYTSTGNLVAESDEVVVVGPGYAWQGAMTAAQLRPVGGNLGNPVGVTAGTAYRLAFAETSGGDCGVGYELGGGNGDVMYSFNTDYSAGLPLTLGSGSSWSGWWNIRAGVETP